MPTAEAGPCTVQKIEFTRPKSCVALLGFAATHTIENCGFFFRPCGGRTVFVVTDALETPDLRDRAAKLMLNFFPTFTEAKRAAARVHWLPVLSQGLEDLPGLIAREWELAQSEGSEALPLFIVWSATGMGVGLVTEDFGEQIGAAAFGFAARLPLTRID